MKCACMQAAKMKIITSVSTVRTRIFFDPCFSACTIWTTVQVSASLWLRFSTGVLAPIDSGFPWGDVYGFGWCWICCNLGVKKENAPAACPPSSATSRNLDDQQTNTACASFPRGFCLDQGMWVMGTYQSGWLFQKCPVPALQGTYQMLVERRLLFL